MLHLRVNAWRFNFGQVLLILNMYRGVVFHIDIVLTQVTWENILGVVLQGIGRLRYEFYGYPCIMSEI